MKVSKLRSGQEVIIRLGKITDADAFIAFVHRVSGESDNLSFGLLTRDFMIEDTFYDCLYMGIEID
ncbi:hypothetical protein [Brevibacillus porteri]|uniref:hypothetical protein n=1 Tax=Brevibacillus porteri TaxID=2126350 RepID=UPI003D2287B2